MITLRTNNNSRTDYYWIGIVSEPILGVSYRIGYCCISRYYVHHCSFSSC